MLGAHSNIGIQINKTKERNKTMARPKNENNRYTLTCKVTGAVKKTNPKQFNDLVNRYGISPTELDNSYVCREGRRQIESEKLTPEQAVDKYGIHINVANTLKCTVKHTAKTPVTPTQEETPEVENLEVEINLEGEGNEETENSSTEDESSEEGEGVTIGVTTEEGGETTYDA